MGLRRRRLAVLGITGTTAAAVVALSLVAPEATRPVDRTLDAVEAFEDLPTTHVDGPIEYATEPPVGGQHADAWLDCGVYDEQVPAENLVHDLEHGTVVIAHDPDLDTDDVDALAAQLPDNGILTPWSGMEAPVVVTVWGRRLQLTGADDPRLPLFVERFGGGGTAPEPFASCAGGTADPSDADDDGVAV